MAPPGFLRKVALPVGLAALAALVLATLLGNFLQNAGPLDASLAAAFAFFAAGAVLSWLDKPKTWGAFAGDVTRGAAIGFAGMGVIQAFFDAGAVPLWALVAGFGWGVQRAHRHVLALVRAQAPPQKQLVLGFLDKRELSALGFLLGGYALAGFALYGVFAAFAGLIPFAGRGLAIGVAVYALYGARLLLKFASHDDAAPAAGLVAWLKANALRNAIVVLLLVAYAVYRDALAASVPYFPLVEFGLGVAVFGFVLARLRARLRRESTARATASEARAHQPRVDRLSEPAYDALARPVGQWLETGRGQREYYETLRGALGAEDPKPLAPVLAYREPPPTPVLPLAFSMMGGMLGALGIAVCLVAAFHEASGRFEPASFPLALAVLALGAYRLQDAARKHLQPWPALGLAALGVALLFAAFLWATTLLGAAPSVVWYVVLGVCAVMLAVPAFSSWRLDKALREGTHAAAPRELPARELQLGLARHRKVAGVATATLIMILLPVPIALKYVADRGLLPAGLVEFYGHLTAAILWVLVGAIASSLVQFFGLARARPEIMAGLKRRRDARLALHHQIMQSME